MIHSVTWIFFPVLIASVFYWMSSVHRIPMLSNCNPNLIQQPYTP